MNLELVSYFENALKQDKSLEEIESKLVNVGWKKEEVHEVKKYLGSYEYYNLKKNNKWFVKLLNKRFIFFALLCIYTLLFVLRPEIAISVIFIIVMILGFALNFILVFYTLYLHNKEWKFSYMIIFLFPFLYFFGSLFLLVQLFSNSFSYEKYYSFLLNLYRKLFIFCLSAIFVDYLYMKILIPSFGLKLDGLFYLFFIYGLIVLWTVVLVFYGWSKEKVVEKRRFYLIIIFFIYYEFLLI